MSGEFPGQKGGRRDASGDRCAHVASGAAMFTAQHPEPRSWESCGPGVPGDFYLQGKLEKAVKKEGGRPPDGLCHSPWRVSRGQRRPSGSFGLQGFPGGRGLGGKPLILGAPGWGAFFPRTRGRRWLRGGGGSRESGRCLPALTLVARQGGGLGTELSEHSVHAPLEVQIHIWAAGWGSFEAGSPWPYPRSHLHSP